MISETTRYALEPTKESPDDIINNFFTHNQTRLSKELKGLLHYPEYWDRNASLWGDVVDWDIFFINKTPSCTAKSAHTALSSELDNLLENFPVGSFQHKKALALRAAIKVKFLIFSDKLLALRPATPSNIWVELRSTWMGKKSAMVSVEETTWHARIIMLGVLNHTLRRCRATLSYKATLRIV
ncbi:hypothetical protein BC936DRAFT_147564 [Jimgerdemannia flammicorona]|uniref:Uncharacterized protein n=1 Tax=Jimgerdemannia flammicorona TaxID=994334 RepID=A0A433D512_9FUNG|nr:hypothetical protein BC936DRAFT_147564 [Jimgerdemannia flammicorona]